ncbi:mevalonate kinase [bacterium]|nr:MAG: mevalonate kinase [bacterium]
MAAHDTDPAPLATATAPGKLILLGEHAVVYGHPAIAVACHAVGARATVFPSGGPLSITAHHPPADQRPPLEIDVASAPADSPLAAAARAALEHAGRTPRTPWHVEVTSSIPTGRGMGSSAAVAVALVRAIGEAAGEDWDDATVASLAYVAEKHAHGTPSGIDNTVIAFGRPIRFQQGRATPIGFGAPWCVLAADSGTAGLTREVVAGVRARRQAHPDVYDDWFRRIGKLVDEAVAALAEGSLHRVGWLMNQNHLVLQAMGVSTPRLDALVGAARGAGAFGAKLSGAGGGGVVVALAAPGTEAAVTSALRQADAAAVWRVADDR